MRAYLDFLYIYYCLFDCFGIQFAVLEKSSILMEQAVDNVYSFICVFVTVWYNMFFVICMVKYHYNDGLW